MSLLLLLLAIVTAQSHGQVTARSNEGALLRPILETTARIVDESGDGILDTDESGTVAVTITNRGGRSSNVVVRLLPLQPAKGLLYDGEVTLKEIPMGESREAKFTVRANEEISTQDVPFNIDVDDLSQLNHALSPIVIRLRALPEPEIVVRRADVSHEMFGSPRIDLVPGREMFLALEIQNKGKRRARDVVVALQYDSLAIDLVTPASLLLGEMQPSAMRSVQFAFRVRSSLKAKSVKLVIQCKLLQTKLTSQFSKILRVRPSKGGKAADVRRR